MQWTDLHAALRSRIRMYRNYLWWALANRTPPGKWKNRLIRRMGVKMGDDVFISPGVIIDPVFPELVHIGNNVFLGWNARIFTHIITPYTPKAYSKFMDLYEQKRIVILQVVVSNNGRYKLILAAGPIYIEDGAFIGGFTTVRAGVRIGEGATIGSDSLVTKDIPPYAVAFGKPAKIKGVIEDGDSDSGRARS